MLAFYMLLVTAGFGAIVIGYLRWIRKPQEVRRFLRLWSACFIYGARYITGVRFRLDGLDNIPGQPVIFVGNHQSYWESIAMTWLVPHINVVTKRKAMSIPIVGWGVRHAPMIIIDKDSPGQNIRGLLETGRASIREGRSILFFPEGQRLRPDQHKTFLRGLEQLYRVCNCAVVPFVTDSGVNWPLRAKAPIPGLITIRFLAAVSPGRDGQQFATDIEKLLNEEKSRLLEERLGE